MAITINGSSGTITGISAGGLPDGVIVNDDIANTTITDGKLATTLDLSGKTLTLPAGAGGKILKVQVTPMSVTTDLYTNTQSYIDSGVTASFTPTASSSKVLVFLSSKVHAHNTSESGVSFFIDIQRQIGSGAFTSVEEFTNCAAIRHATTSGSTTSQFGTASFFAFEDLPNTTDPCTYKLQHRSNSSAGYLQWTDDNIHVWTFIEVAA